MSAVRPPKQGLGTIFDFKPLGSLKHVIEGEKNFFLEGGDKSY